MAHDDEEPAKTSPLAWGAVALMAIALAVVGLCFFFRGADAQVNGTVTLDGQPVAGALVTFVTDDEQKESVIVASTNESGAFRLVGNAGGGIPVGKYKVAVSKEALADGTVPAGKELTRARQQGLLANILPPIYEDKATTPLLVDIRAGVNKLPLVLKKEP